MKSEIMVVDIKRMPYTFSKTSLENLFFKKIHERKKVEAIYIKGKISSTTLNYYDFLTFNFAVFE